MDLDSVEDLKTYGFVGFKRLSEVFDDYSVLPKVRGIYLILNPAHADDPEFLPVGTGGLFKSKDPNVDMDELGANWVKNRLIVYIGKAGGEGSKATLHSRLKQYFDFGQQKPVGHYGGRYIWQLKHAKDLLVCWKPMPSEDPRAAEAELIRQFVHAYGARPFANLKD